MKLRPNKGRPEKPNKYRNQTIVSWIVTTINILFIIYSDEPFNRKAWM